jgi:polyisoprenoid-binding protein YceI
MKKLLLTNGIALLGMLLFLVPTYAQNTYVLSNTSEVNIAGTSTIHDWESVVEKSTARLVTSKKDEQLLINQMELTIQTASIKSGKDLMDKKTYEALKEEQYPTITFTLTEPLKLVAGQVAAKGKLKLAGVEKIVEVKGTLGFNNNAQITINASYSLNMRDYNIDPPTAMFGSIKTGEQVTINFDLLLTKAPEAN